jgi:phage-related protein (TIGR01555 family)
MRAKTKKRIARDKKPALPTGVQQQQSVGFDYFSNVLARMGWGTPSLAEGTQYVMERLSLNYWLMLTLYRNHWLARRIVDLPAADMTRAWPKIVSDMEPDDISTVDRTIRRTYTPRRLRQALKWARLYGGAGCVMAIKGHEKFLDEPLDLDDVNPQSYLGLIPFDRWVGISPEGTISEDLTKPQQWGLPEYYKCMAENTSSSFRIHASRILRFTGPEVPVPEFQASQYWGISVLEVVYETLRKLDNASWSILNLLFRSNLIARVDPELGQMLSGLGVSGTALQRWNAVMQAQNELLSNQSMLVMGKDADLKSLQYSFAGIGEVFAQFQMDASGASEIPVTRLFGKTISGLGQSNDADERYYEERIAQNQDEDVRPPLDQLYPVIYMSEFGEVPDDLDLHFPSIRVLQEEEKAELAEKAGAVILAAFNTQVVGRKTALKELQHLGETTGIWTNITDEDVDKAEEEPEPPVEAPGAGGEGPEDAMRKESGGAEDAAFDADLPPTDEKIQRDAPDVKRLFAAGVKNGTYAKTRPDFRKFLHHWYPDWDETVHAKIARACGYDTNSARDARPLHGKVKWHGLDISIENKAGTKRSGVDAGGNKWSTTMTHDYGYLRGTRGVDGDHVDCFLGLDPTSETVYVIHTMKAPLFTDVDEDKCMLNFATEAAARAAFFANYDRPEHFGSLEKISVGAFIDRVLATKEAPQLITA